MERMEQQWICGSLEKEWKLRKDEKVFGGMKEYFISLEEYF